jgi:hypothetical protein
MTTPWRSAQDAEKANETVAWQALPCCLSGGSVSKHRKLALATNQEFPVPGHWPRTIVAERAALRCNSEICLQAEELGNSLLIDARILSP